VPRISAATVAEHRANQLRTLLDAARDLVAEQGADALTLAELARRVGLSRPSLYEYFRSREDLVNAILSDELPRWGETLAEAVRGASGLTEQVEAYLRAQVRIVADGRHRAAVLLAAHALPEASRAQIRDAHERLLAPLTDALAAAGVPEPDLRAHLVHGMVEAAAHRMTPGDTVRNEEVLAALLAQALHGLPARPDQ
jgi:AcrR family transcriptional regulator